MATADAEVDGRREQQIRTLLREMVEAVALPHAVSAMWDAVWAIEDRAQLRPAGGRDTVMEALLRDTLVLLTKSAPENPLFGIRATELIDALISVPYTERAHRVTRLVRGLIVLAQSGSMDVARQAAAVLGRVLREDRGTDVKDMVREHLRDLCDVLQSATHHRSQPQRGGLQNMTGALAVILAVAKEAPRWLISTNKLDTAAQRLRTDVLTATAAACSATDAVVRSLARDTLGALLVAPGPIYKPVDVSRVFDEQLKNVQGTSSDSTVVGGIVAVSAILAARGMHDVDRQKIQTVCNTVQVHRSSRSQAIRAAIACAIPVFSRFDPLPAQRMAIYTATLIDPMKRLKELVDKEAHFDALASFITLFGYSGMDDASRRNVETIILDIITTRVGPVEAAWGVVAAMCKAKNTALIIANCARCAAAFSRCVPSTALFAHAEVIAASHESLRGPFVSAMLALAARVIQIAQSRDQAGGSGTPATPRGSGSSGGGSSNNTSSSGAREAGSNRDSPSFGNSGAGASASGAAHTNSSTTPAPAPSLSGSFFRRIFWKDDGGGSGQAHTIDDRFVSEEHVTAVLQWMSTSEHNSQSTEETRVNVVPLLRHPSPIVRRECCDAVMSVIERHLRRMSSAHHATITGGLNFSVAVVPPPTAVVSGAQQPATDVRASGDGVAAEQQPTTTATTTTTAVPPEGSATASASIKSTANKEEWNNLVTLVEAFARQVVMEDEPHMRVSLLQGLEKKLADNKALYELIGEPAVLPQFYTFVHDRNRVRAAALRILCATSRRCDVREVVVELSTVVHTTALSFQYTTSPASLVAHMADLSCFAAAGFAEFFIPNLVLLLNAFSRHIAAPQTSEVAQVAMLVCLERIIATLKQSDASVEHCMPQFLQLAPVVHTIIFSGASQAARQAAVCVMYWLYTIVQVHPTTQEYAELIQGLSQVYVAATTQNARLEVMMTLGVLGAVDPTPVKQEVVADTRAEMDCGFVSDDYSAIVYNVLLGIVNETSNEGILRGIIRTILQVVKFSSRESIGGKRAARALFALVERSDRGSQFRVDVILSLAALLDLRREVVFPLLNELVAVLQSVWTTSERETLLALLAVVKAAIVSNISVAVQSETWPWLYAKLVDVVSSDQTKDVEAVLRGIEIFDCCEEVPPSGVHLAMPCFGALIEQSQHALDVRCAALSAALKIVCRQSLVRHVPPLLQSLRHMTRQLTGDANLALRLKGMQSQFVVFHETFPSARTTIRRILGDCEVAVEHETDSGTGDAVSANSFAAAGSAHSGNVFRGAASMTPPTGRSPGEGGTLETGERLSIDALLFLVAKVSNSSGVSAVDWKVWFADLQRTLLVSSPHFAFRECVGLYDKHTPLRIALFPAAFYCAYCAMGSGDRHRVEQVLRAALHQSADPDITACCLALADFMDHGEAFLEDQERSSERSGEHGNRVRKSLSTQSVDHLGMMNATNGSSAAAAGASRGVGGSEDQAGDGLLIAMHAGTGGAMMGMGMGASGRDMSMGMFASSPTTLADAARWAKIMARVPSVTAFDAEGGATPLFLSSTVQGGTVAWATAGGVPPPTSPTAVTAAGTSVGSIPFTTGISSLLSRAEQQRATAASGRVRQLFLLEELCESATAHSHNVKAMRFRELSLLRSRQVLVSGTASVAAEALARAYGALGMQASVKGLFESCDFVAKDPGLLELLQTWPRANEAYRQRLAAGDRSSAYVEGFVRTSNFLGLWRDALDCARRYGAGMSAFGRSVAGSSDDVSHDTLLQQQQQQQHQSQQSQQRQTSITVLSPRSQTPQAEHSRASEPSADTTPLIACTKKLAEQGALAAWVLGEWEDLARFSSRIDDNVPMSSLFTGVLLFRRNAATDLLACLERGRRALEKPLRTLLQLSYSHVYDIVAMLQHYRELEEAMEYHLTTNVSRQAQLRELWRHRFFAMRSDVVPMVMSLAIRSLVLPNQALADCWIHFAKSLQPTHPEIASWATQHSGFGAIAPNPPPTAAGGAPAALPLLEPALLQLPAEVEFSPTTLEFCRILWSSGKTDLAVGLLSRLVDRASAAIANAAVQTSTPSLSLSFERSVLHGSAIAATAKVSAVEFATVGQMHLQLAKWQQATKRTHFWHQPHRDGILRHLHAATHRLPTNYDAWHQWALMNYRIQQRSTDLKPEDRAYIVSKATDGFVTAISHSTNETDVLQAILRMLQMWVVNGGLKFLSDEAISATYRISVAHWAAIVPQLIAHLGSEDRAARDVMCRILRRVCQAHPQALVFPLLVPFISRVSNFRSEIAEEILHECCPPQVLKEAELVARNLIEAAATPTENFREAFGHVLRCMHDNGEMIVPADLAAAKEYMAASAESFLKNLEPRVADFERLIAMRANVDATTVAQEIYEQVDEHLRHTMVISLSRMRSPLRTLQNSVLCIPGEYNFAAAIVVNAATAMSPAAAAAAASGAGPKGPSGLSVGAGPGNGGVGNSAMSSMPLIVGFHDRLQVIPSKHRPRKLQIVGSNGRTYPFVLKANEDIRIDERVMQLFSLVNALLLTHSSSATTQVARFPVIPLSSKVGMAGWVENTETLLSTIVQYRRLVGANEQLEPRLMTRDASDFQSLTLLQKADVLGNALNQSPCNDIARSMWLRSPTAEMWLDRRTTFTSSLAAMSIVGYVMGLGDRHLGNILTRVSTGQVVHVDFGDCFDVARCRGAFPETVPFRLTPNLVNAMEVIGVNGVFLSTASRTMTVLRTNSDAIVALLSAFIYDPIVNLRFVDMPEHSSELVERIRAKLGGTEFTPSGSRNKWGVLPVRPDIQFCRSLYPNTNRDELETEQVSVGVTTSSATQGVAGNKRCEPTTGSPPRRDPTGVPGPQQQVTELIRQATSHDNLSAMYTGWCPWW